MMYIPLKVTTDYSLLKSLIKINDLILFLVQNNIKACAIVDNNLSGSIEFYNKCLDNNIKPIIGLEIILRDKIIYLYAKDYEGYKNLIKINTCKQKEELSISNISKYCDNLICVIPYESRELYQELEIFNDKYISYKNQLEKINSKLITSNTIYLNDIKCFKKEDLKYLTYLDQLAQLETIDYLDNYFVMDNDLIDNNEINKIVNSINIIIPKNNRYIPKYNNSVDNYKFLHDLSLKGLHKRLNNNVSKVYLDRLNYELSVIKKMNFVDYFLIVYDYVLYAKKHNILVGPGRGSAAGSLVSYSIGITEIDPIKYNLLFERFLNPERITMPDIDIDFDAVKRDEVINYVKDRYGIDCVALGLTYNTYKAKLILRDLARLLKIDNDLLEKFIKNINSQLSLKDNLKNDTIKKYINNYKELKELYKISLKLENLKKNTSVHAAGVVISSIKLDEIIPIISSDDGLITGITMDYLEQLGLLKMDFLALKNLTTIDNILNMIGNNVLKGINLEDKKVFQIFNNIDVDGIFQFETPVMKSFLQKFKIDAFSDLVASLALVRPGAKDYIDTYIKRKKGILKVEYLHKDLESILKETYGIILYQEQIMAILTKIGGYTLSQADIIRRAISKKKENIIKAEEEKFINSAVKNGYDKNIAISIYNDIIKFASYGFNKAHSVAYAHISYQMAYLKTYYKEIFLLEELNNINNLNMELLSILKKNNISIIKPSVKNTNLSFKIENKVLYLPLYTIKGITSDITKRIVTDSNYYDNYFEFLKKTIDYLNSELITNLIHAGALDCFNLNHQTMINNLEVGLNYAMLSVGAESLIDPPTILEYEEFSDNFLRKKELNMYGVYISNHPASKYNTKDFMKLENIKNNCFKKIKCAVLVDNIKTIKTKKGEDMAFLRCSDETSTVDATIFPDRYYLLKKIKKDEIIIIVGEVSKRFDKYQIIVNNILESGESYAR